MSSGQFGRLEGDGVSRLKQLMGIYGRNVDSRYHVATVKSVSPFAMNIAGDPFDIEDDGYMILVPQCFLPHERKVKISGQATLGSTSGAFNGDTLTLKFSDDYVKVGDQIIVIEIKDGQQYIVLDKLV